MNDRITMVIGAGAPLDFDMPTGMKRPTTGCITDEVRRPYRHFDNRDIDIVEKMYQVLKNNYPLTPSEGNDWKREGNFYSYRLRFLNGLGTINHEP